MKKQSVLFVVWGVLLLSWNIILVYTIVAGHSGGAVTGRTQSNGESQFCLNYPPSISIPCNTTLSQNSSYYCQLNVTDVEGGNTTVSQVASGTAIFNVSINGTINFTPTNDDVGNHTTTFFVDDNTECANSLGSLGVTFSVENVNDPPRLVQNISDQSFAVNTSLVAFFLNDYFDDPDGDALTYTSTVPTGITVSIQGTSLVTFTSSTCDTDGELVTFTATDPYNASAESNVLTVSVTCNTPTSSSGAGSTGGGGGGGGGALISCRTAWECEEWFACLPAGVQWRRCYDTNGCTKDEYLKRNCTYSGAQSTCQENWLCQEWGRCFINGTQYRTCRDLTACGTTIALPPTGQRCNYEPTCNDQVQNGNETGIDCGGPLCPSCAFVQQPLPIAGAGLRTWLLILIILALLLVSGAAHFYRSEIAQLIARLGFLVRRQAYKDILLDATQRRSFFERILALEQLVQSEGGKNTNTLALYEKVATLIRSYTSESLSVDLEVLPEEVGIRCKEWHLRKETTAMIMGLFSKLGILEHENVERDDYFVLATLEELRTAVCLTSDYNTNEILRVMEELAVPDTASFYDEIFIRSINLLRAVQYKQLEIAKREYMLILSRYDPLSVQEKEQVYSALVWLFDVVKFQSEIVGSHHVDKVLASS